MYYVEYISVERGLGDVKVVVIRESSARRIVPESSNYGEDSVSVELVIYQSEWR